MGPAVSVCLSCLHHIVKNMTSVHIVATMTSDHIIATMTGYHCYL
jgi:hypothetical protein